MEAPPQEHDTADGNHFSSPIRDECKDFTGSDEGGSERQSLLSYVPMLKPRLVGAALENLGNTCFLNSVLQCITHTVPLLLGLSSAEHPSPCAGNDGDFCALCSLREHVTQCLDLSKQVVSPSNFAQNLSKISSDFKLGMQEDAHEFLHCLLDQLHNCYIDPTMKDKPSSLEEDSLVKQVFAGRLRSQVICCECGHCSDTFEPLLDLSLEIDDAKSIKDALDSFTRQEKIDDPEIRFNCNGCGAQVTVVKQLKLDQAPPVIALHLKRFKHTGFSTDKIYNFVEYPLELDLKPYLSCTDDNDEQFKYDLYAIIVHLGSSAYSGHYYSYIRSSPTTWHDMDDDQIMSVPQETVLNQTAYILFYLRQGSSPWFSSLLEKKIAEDEIRSSNSPISVLESIERSSPSPSDEEASCSTARKRQCNIHHSNYKSDTYVQESVDGLRDNAEIDATSLTFMEKLQEETEDCRQLSQVPNSVNNESHTEAQVSGNAYVEVFVDEHLEDEDEDDMLIPNMSFVRKREMAVEKPANELNTTIDPHLKTYLNRNCCSSRRQQLLSCYSDVAGPRSLTSKIRPLGTKKRRLS